MLLIKNKVRILHIKKKKGIKEFPSALYSFKYVINLKNLI